MVKCKKAGGPIGLAENIFKAASNAGVKAMTILCNKILFEGYIPSEWELNILVHVYHRKGDPLNCGFYHAIKLLEHG